MSDSSETYHTWMKEIREDKRDICTKINKGILHKRWSWDDVDGGLSYLNGKHFAILDDAPYLSLVLLRKTLETGWRGKNLIKVLKRIKKIKLYNSRDLF